MEHRAIQREERSFTEISWQLWLWAVTAGAHLVDHWSWDGLRWTEMDWDGLLTSQRVFVHCVSSDGRPQPGCLSWLVHDWPLWNCGPVLTPPASTDTTRPPAWPLIPITNTNTSPPPAQSILSLPTQHPVCLSIISTQQLHNSSLIASGLSEEKK